MTHETGDIDEGFARGLRRSNISLSIMLGSALLSAVFAAPANADTGLERSGFDDAHSLRSLDIMLMVTALRCRGGAHDFQADYHRFSAANLNHLNAASTTLKRTFQASYGETNPARALDRMGVRIANTYGDGHPWLSCAELKQVAQQLSVNWDAPSLATNARYLLSAKRPEPARPAPTAPSTEQVAQKDEPVQLTYNMTAKWEMRP